jgi:hypothetical protein
MSLYLFGDAIFGVLWTGVKTVGGASQRNDSLLFLTNLEESTLGGQFIGTNYTYL